MRAIIIAALVFGFLLIMTPVSASQGKLVIVCMEGVSLDEALASNLPTISKLIREGASGVMNVRPGSVQIDSDDIAVRRYSVEGTSATIGAGARAAATSVARNAYGRFERVESREARELYASMYGRSGKGAEVLHLGMNRLKYLNSQARYPIHLGAVGDALHQAGLRTAALGNSDLPDDLRRATVMIAADSNGIVDFGNVGSAMRTHDDKYPYGVRTNAARLIDVYFRVLPKSDLIIVDVGDTARASGYATHCLDQQATLLKRQALENADRLIKSLLKGLDLSRDGIMLISTNPSPQAIENRDLLPPVIIAGHGVRKGLITSGSTRQAGIVTSADISASILDFFGIETPYSFSGRPIAYTAGSPDELSRMNHRIISQMERQPAMRGMASFMILWVVFISIVLLVRKGASRWLRWAALVPPALMLAALWLPAILDVGLMASVAAMAGLAVVSLIVSWALLHTPEKGLFALSAALAITAIIDLFAGQRLLSSSIMSYTPVDGSRYYGIGNEYMGSVIAAGMITTGFVAALLARNLWIKMLAALIIFHAVMITILSPSFGANAGGGMSAAVAGVVGLFLWRGRKIKPQHIALALAVIPVALGFMVGIDLLRSGGAESHVGRAYGNVAAGGLSQFFTIIARKSEMNLMLLRYSPWSRLLFVCIASIATVFSVRRLGALERLKSRRDIYAGFCAATAGAVAALLLNDSGVVAAATAAIYIWSLSMLNASEISSGA